MKKYFFAVLLSVLASCGNNDIIKLIEPSAVQTYRLGDVVNISCKTSSDVDSLVLYIADKRIGLLDQGNFSYNTAENRFGKVYFAIKAYKGDRSEVRKGTFDIMPAVPERFNVKVINVFPHDKGAYTQGLLIDNGTMYESTGQYGTSSLRIVDWKTGKVLKKTDLDPDIFGEGIALLGDKIYQLSWREGLCMVYDKKNLSKIGQFKYTTEGWGITTDGEKLYMSDGTHNIYVINPDNFRVESRIEVFTDKDKLQYINELEWIDGKIWANIYSYTFEIIVVIDPASGAVEKIIDASNLLSPSDKDENTDVINGIAYDKDSKKIYITGKNWSKLFEIEIVK